MPASAGSEKAAWEKPAAWEKLVGSERLAEREESVALARWYWSSARKDPR
jgi:hypothetical protein